VILPWKEQGVENTKNYYSQIVKDIFVIAVIRVCLELICLKAYERFLKLNSNKGSISN